MCLDIWWLFVGRFSLVIVRIICGYMEVLEELDEVVVDGPSDSGNDGV